MTETLNKQATGAGGPAPDASGSRAWGGRTITTWDPEDRAFWDATGRPIARRNLLLSIFSEHIGFSVWSLWSVFVLFLTPAYGISADPKHAAAEKFTLTILPTAVGAVARIPYTFAIAKFGGRNWTVVSALLLLIPTITAAFLLKPGSTYGTLIVLALLAGFGGGNFASSMANINAFYPQRLKGAALGLNAGGGNIGVATVQLVALAVLATAGKGHPRVILDVYIPLIVLAALAAALFMDNLAHVQNDKRAMRDVSRDPHTWAISLLYIGTFGTFIGFGFAFGQVLQNQFPTHFYATGKHVVDPVKIAYLTFLGPLVGSLVRPVGGWLADRIGGAKTTFWNFVAMAIGAAVVLIASRNHSLPLFFFGFIALFVFSGIGNGAVYKMIPAIFRAKAGREVSIDRSVEDTERQIRRLSSGLIGIAGAIGAAGGALVNIAFRESFLNYKTGDGAYIGFIAFYAVCFLVTWAVYLRRGPGALNV